MTKTPSSKQVQFVEAVDGTRHAFPANARATEIERYLWRYENGQDLPKFAFTAPYREARAKFRGEVYLPKNEARTSSSTRSKQVVRITARAGEEFANDNVARHEVCTTAGYQCVADGYSAKACHNAEMACNYGIPFASQMPPRVTTIFNYPNGSNVIAPGSGRPFVGPKTTPMAPRR